MKQDLRTGKIYRTSINKINNTKRKYSGKVIYVGKLLTKNVFEYPYVIILRGKNYAEAFRFREYELKNGELSISRVVKSRISELERKFVDERLKKAGL